MTFLGEFVMERRSGTDALRAVPALPGPVSAALVLGFAFVLGAGEAAAQRVCSNTPTGAQTIDCTRGDANDIDIDAHDVAISTTNAQDFGVYARHTGSGDVNVALTGGSVTTAGAQGYGVIGWHVGASGAVDVDIKNTIVKTSGFNAFGVIGVHQGAGTVAVNVDIEGGVVETTGYPSHAVRAVQAGPGDVALGLKDTTVRTTNAGTAHGVVAQHTGATGSLRVDVRGGSVETFGLHSFAVFGSVRSTPGGGAVSVADASVTTRGRFARAIVARHRGEGAIAVDVSGDTAVTAEGEGGIGVEALSGGGGAVEIAVGADVAIEAPFANGIVGRRTAPGLPTAAPGRMVVTHGGRVRARNVGVFTWVDPMSGSTFGDGESATETDGDEPAIHVTSSGDVTVGENVMDAYIRAAVAGEDETLQAGEQAVLDAITAGDSDALETALAALPDSYSDVWQTRVRGFLAARALSPTDRFSWTGGVEPTDPGRRLADEAAGEILGLSHAGIRAMALSHLAVVNHIREGDVDPDIVASVATITAIAENARTPQQRATLAMQQETLATQRMLSPAERMVLEAALTGGDLDAALAALPAAYTDAWKDEVRRRAAGYNAGDVQVDVTGGTITSDGDGVDARYVLAHDRNGAIAVTVADGARITGERHGLYLGGAGLADGNDDLRDQTATVNGAVMGGTGAGVYLAGGGTVTVGRTGRVGATSGDGVLSDGAGDLVATVAGRVEGDIRAQGGGALTLNVMEGGVVTGTVHDPAGPLTVAGSIGRLLYTNGGAVTVAAAGRLTGVEAEGRTEAIRSEAGDLGVTVAAMGRVTGDLRAMGGGDLDATISGTVEGDLLAQGGGALTVDVQEGGEVTGTVHDPAGPLTVHGSIGRLLYASGGTVTVADTGWLTGVEVEGRREAIRSEAGDLSVTVAGMGTVTGNILGMGAGGLSAMVAGTVTGDVIEEGAGDLDATISGTVEGNVFGRGTGEHTVTVSDGGEVTGAIHLAASTVTMHGTAGRVQFDEGGTVTVGGTGRIAGIEGVAIWNAADALSVTVAAGGRVEGDIVDLGDHPARVTTEDGSTVMGTIDVAGEGSAVTVGGDVEGGVQFGRGGMVTIGPQGQVTDPVETKEGELVVEVQQDTGETPGDALSRGIPGGIVEPGGTPDIIVTPQEGEAPRRVGAAGTASSVPDGAYDVGLRPDEDGVYQVEPDIAPRSRLYEALPSVLLGLNAPARYEERMTAPRAEQGSWARVETVHGKWKADASTSRMLSGVELEYDHRRHGLQAGMDVAAGEDGLLGVSLHHRRGSADVSKGGKVELSGHGVGVSGAWVRDGVYVDVQAEATWYEADFTSSLRGVLEQDVSGHGYALGVEAGRRLASGWAGMVLTPRAGLVHSRVFVGGFTDAVGTQVSVEDGRSLKGRAGMLVEVKSKWWAQGSRVFGSVDVEREFSKDRKVRVSGTELRSEADATWLRVGLNGSHVLDGGRWTVAGRVGYATSGGSHELGGGLHLKMRF